VVLDGRYDGITKGNWDMAMPSFFPGMDPFLEHPAFWPDFHPRFINYWAEAVADQLPDEYEARIGERVYLAEVDPETRKLIYPDVSVTDSSDRMASPTSAGAAVAELQPVTIPLEMLEGPREAYIEILHRPERSLVGVLELLSPANKHDPGRTEYLSKRNAIVHQSVHLAELDLLCGGRRLPLTKPLPPADYYYFLARAEQRPNCQVFRWNLDRPLQSLPIPLRSPHPDVHVDLAQVFSTAYDRGRFRRSINYAAPCPAPLRPEQRRWVEATVAAHLRS
jgi:hypothetical protein